MNHPKNSATVVPDSADRTAHLSDDAVQYVDCQITFVYCNLSMDRDGVVAFKMQFDNIWPA